MDYQEDSLSRIQRLYKIVLAHPLIALQLNGTKPPTVHLANSHNINAYAMITHSNKTRVELTRGALNLFSDDEVEFIIAHELSHHLDQDYFKPVSFLQPLLTVSGFIIGVITSIKISVFTLFPIIAILVYLNLLLRKRQSRALEFKADSFAVKVTSQEVGILVVEKLFLNSRVDRTLLVRFFNQFSTHPTKDERIKNIKSSMKIPS